MQVVSTQEREAKNNVQRAKAAYGISIGTGAMLASAVMLTIVFGSKNINPVSFGLLIAGTFLSFLGAWLARREKHETGILLVIVSLIAITFARVFVQKGLAIPTGIANVIIVSGIALYTLRPAWVARATIAAFLVSAASVVIDQYSTGIPASSNPQVGTIFAAVISLVYLAIIVLRFQKLPLLFKLIVGFAALTSIPLIILGWQSYASTADLLNEQVSADLRETAASNAAALGSFLETQLNVMRTESRAPDIVDFLRTQEDSVEKEHAAELLNVLVRKDPIYISSYFLLNNAGINVMDVNPQNVGQNFAQYSFFTQPYIAQTPYISSPLTDPNTGELTIYFSAPVIDETGNLVGVLVSGYHANVLQALMRKSAESASTGTEYAYLLNDKTFLNLAHTSRPDVLHKTYRPLTDIELLSLQEQGLIESGTFDELVFAQPEVVEALSGMGSETQVTINAWESNGAPTLIAAARVQGVTWIVVAAQPQDAIVNLTQNQTRATVATVLVITAVAVILAALMANLLTRPIRQLTLTAESISQGDFSARSAALSEDELGDLGNTINSMAAQIQELISNLESRVNERTADLEAATKQSEKRAEEFQAISETARIISTEKDLEKLLTLVTNVVSERFNFYHVGVFLVDDNKNFAVLRASNSEGGKRMLKRQHKLEIGQTGIVGNVTHTGVPRIALNTGADATYFNNPDLPLTRSEMALPLSVRGEIIGALDVQSTEANAFSESDVATISLLADQVAIAIDNTRLLEETQSALAESQAVFREYLAEAWKRQGTGDAIGYYQGISGGKLITAENEADVNIPPAEQADASLNIPIRIRDQVIGALNVRPSGGGKTWKKEDVAMIEAVTERLALALDNARLFEETSLRASRERAVAEITTKIRGTNDPNEMIATAVDELKRLLGATRVEIVPQKNVPPPDR